MRISFPNHTDRFRYALRPFVHIRQVPTPKDRTNVKMLHAPPLRFIFQTEWVILSCFAASVRLQSLHI